MTDTPEFAPFRCPTSGQMLGAAVTAFRLHIERVGGPTAEFLGSGNPGKRARDFFEGKWVPEDTRNEICTWVSKALIHSGLVPSIRPPGTAEFAAADLESLFRMTIFTWLQIWDGAFYATATLWSEAEPALSGFVLGRQVVIDLAMRWGALCELCGVKEAGLIGFEGALAGKGAPILRKAMERAGRSLTREELARALRVGGEGTNDRTVDRWFDELVIPDDENLEGIADVLAGDNKEMAASLLRFLRLQFGVLKLTSRLSEFMGSHLSEALLKGLVQFTGSGLLLNRVMRENVDKPPSSPEKFGMILMNLVMMGSAAHA